MCYNVINFLDGGRMTTYSTQNPLGSADPRDLYDNAENLDEAINGEASAWTDRLGNTRKTFRAAENAAQAVEDSAATHISAIEQDATDVDSAATNAITTLIPAEVQRVTDDANTAINTEIPAEIDRIEPAATEALNELLIAGGRIFDSEEQGRDTVLDGQYYYAVSDDPNVSKTLWKRVNESESEFIADDPSADAVTPLQLGLLNKVDKLPISNYQGILFSVVDDDNHMTWLSVDSKDGGPTEESAKLIKKSIGMIEPKVPDVFYAVVDKDNRMTWLSVDSIDGGPTKESANLIKKSIGMIEPKVSGVFYAVVDKDDRMTWLSVDSIDGGPTKESANLIKKSIGMTDPNVPDVFYAVVDKDNRMTDLTLDQSGQLADWVVERLAKRMSGNGFDPQKTRIAAKYPQLTTTEQAITGGDFYDRNGEILPVLTDMTKLSGWGSSSMQLSASAYGDLAASIGATYYNGGRSTTGTQHIAAHLGAIPPLITFENNTILGSGRTKFATSSMTNNNRVNITGVVAGVHGRIYVDSGFWFEPTTPLGSDLNVEPDLPFYSEIGGIYRNGVCFLWMGRNNLRGVQGQAEEVIEQTDKSFDFIAPLVKRSLVLGHMIGQHEVENSETWEQIIQVNEAHRRRYGHLYIDVMEYLTSERLWTDLGIAPTQADLDNQAAGKTPPSAAQHSEDNLHLSPAAYHAVVMNVVKPRMVQLGWID